MGRLRTVGAACLAAMLGLMLPSLALADAPVLPNTGVDVPAFVQVVITGLGSVIAACVAGYFAFLVVRLGIRWAGRLLSGA